MTSPDIYGALQGRHSFTLNNQGEVILDSPFTTFRKWSKSYRTEEAEKIAEKIFQDLNALDRLPPHQAKKSQVLKGARAFRKKIASRCLPSAIFKRLQEAEIAFSVGLTLDTCKKNEGFLSFARETSMGIYLSRHKLQLKVKDGVIICPLSPKADKKFNLPEGTSEAQWSDIKASLAPKMEKFREESFSHYFFRDGGLTFKSFYREPKEGKTQKLRVFRDKKENHKWGDRYVLEICVHSEGAGITGNHSWWRYKTPEGVVYSDSKYRQKGGFKDSRLQKARTQNPDSSEYTPGYHHKKIALQITKEQFEKLYQHDTDLINGKKGQYTFHNLNQNCTDEALIRLQMAGYKVPDFTVTFWRVFGNPTLVKSATWVYEALQHIHQKVADVFFTALVFIGNLFQAWYRGFEPNPLLEGDSRYFKSFSDLLDEKKLHHTSPYYLLDGPYRELEKWRNSLKNNPAELRKRGITASEVDYLLPDEWKISFNTL